MIVYLDDQNRKYNVIQGGNGEEGRARAGIRCVERRCPVQLTGTLLSQIRTQSSMPSLLPFFDEMNKSYFQYFI